MSTAKQRIVPLLLAAVSFRLPAPSTLAAQTTSSRPATVELTVVVPPPTSLGPALTSEDPASVVSATPNGIDLEMNVGLANRQPARIEVRLGAGWAVGPTQVWVRNTQGEFEPLQPNASVVAVDSPPLDPTQTRSTLFFRVRSPAPRTAASLAIPVEYRLTVGGGDTFSVWSFSSLLRTDSGVDSGGVTR